MNRRSFLQKMAAAGLLFGLPGTGKRLRVPGAWDGYSRPDLLAMLDDAEAVRAIGRAYRRRFPAHDDAHTLGRLLQAEAAGLATTVPMTAQTPAKKLTACVQADFARGRTVQLQGWILAVTEARQCALFSLLAP